MWRQGEHVAIVGQTGSGKSYLEERLVWYRGHVLVLRTKPDPKIKFTGLRRIRSIREISVNHNRYLLEPKYERQREECHATLEMAWRAGGWCVAIDEAYYAIDQLHLASDITRLMTQARTLNVSVINGMQRFSYVPRWCVSEATHVFAFTLEGRDIKVLADATTPRVIPLFEGGLRRHEFVYFNRATKEVAIGKADDLEELFDARPYPH